MSKNKSNKDKRKDNVVGNIILSQVNKHIDSTTQQLISVGVNVMDDLTKRIGELYAAGEVEEAQKLVDKLAEVKMKDELSKKEDELKQKYEDELARRGVKQEKKPVLTSEKGLELLKAGKIKEFNDARNVLWEMQKDKDGNWLLDEKEKPIPVKRNGKMVIEGYKPINFSGLDLSGLDLTEEIEIDDKKVRIGANLSNCNLAKANLQNVNAQGVKFRNSTLDKVVVTDTDLHRADFVGASTKGVDFTVAKTLPLTRDEAIKMLEEGKIREFNNRRYKTTVPLDLSGLKFEGKNFSYDIGGGKAGGINLQYCDLTETAFKGCDMRNANFFHAKIAGVDFAETKLYSAWIKGDVKEIDLSNVSLDGGHLKGTDFSGSNISGSSFKKADLSGVNFTNAKIENSNFDEANLTKAFMNKTLVKDCSFKGANMEGLQAPKAVFEGKIDLSDTNLKDANLWSVDISKAKEVKIEGNVQMSRGVKTEVGWEKGKGTLLPKGLDKEYAKELKSKFTVAEPGVKETEAAAPKAFETDEVEEAYTEPEMEMTT